MDASSCLTRAAADSNKVEALSKSALEELTHKHRNAAQSSSISADVDVQFEHRQLQSTGSDMPAASAGSSAISALDDTKVVRALSDAAASAEHKLLEAQRERDGKIRQLEQTVAELKLNQKQADSGEVAIIAAADVRKIESSPLGRGSSKTAWLCEWRGKHVVKLEFAANASRVRSNHAAMSDFALLC